MSHEVHGLGSFYASAPGVVARRMLRAGLRRMWPDLRGLEVAGVGWASPYLGVWPGAARAISLVPAPLAEARPPAPCALIPESVLPLADLSLDRILLVHALEAVPNPAVLLRECWRVLRDDGRLLVVLPNRHGCWSLFDHTPFGQGRPWSRGQLGRLLESRLFRVSAMRPALFVPPFAGRWALAGADVWEGLGRAALPGLSGVVLAEAVKDVMGVVPGAGLEAAMTGARSSVLRPIPGVSGHGMVGPAAPATDNAAARGGQAAVGGRGRPDHPGREWTWEGGPGSPGHEYAAASGHAAEGGRGSPGPSRV